MNWINNNNMNGNGMNNFRPNQVINNMYNLPHYESPTIHGRTEANAFQMGPNSSIFLPDGDNDIIWWIRTDHYGNRTVDPFDISPHKDLPPIDLNSLEARLASVEEWIHAKSNKSNAKRNTSNVSAIAATVDNEQLNTTN